MNLARGGNHPTHINVNAPTVGILATKRDGHHHHASTHAEDIVEESSNTQDNIVEDIKEQVHQSTAQEKELSKNTDNVVPVDQQQQQQDVRTEGAASNAPETSLITQYVLVGGGPAAYTAMNAIYEREPTADVN